MDLLTDLANRLLPLPSEVLVLQPQTFAPMSWELADQKRLFAPSLTNPSTSDAGSRGPLTPPSRPPPPALATSPGFGPSDSTCQDALAWLRQREQSRADAADAACGLDFASSYVLHAFNDSIRRVPGWDHVIDLDHVLARQSVYARAVFPAVWHAVQAGVMIE